MMSLILQTGMSAAQFKQEKRYNCKNCNHFKGKKIMNDKNTDIQSVSIQTSKSLSIDDSICIQQQVTIQLHWIFFNNVTVIHVWNKLSIFDKKIDMIYKSKHLIITCVHVIVNTSTANKSNYVPKWITFTGSSIKPPFLSYEKPDVVFKRTTAGISRSGTKPEICSPLKRKKTRPHARNRGKVSTSSVSKKHAAVGFQLRPHFLQRRRARRLIWGQLRRASQGGYVWLECVKQLFQALGAEKP